MKLSNNQRFIHITCGIVGGPEKWDALVANLTHRDNVDVIEFSLDSTMFISLGKETLKVLDAATGTPISDSTISGGRFAISNDFSTVASFKGNVITLYDVNSSERGAAFTTRTNILSVAISSQSSRIAATLSDRNLLL